MRPKIPINRVARRALEACEYAEHIGFVLVALIDALDFGHNVLRLVSVWLVFSGAGVLIRQRPKGGSVSVTVE